MVSFWCTPIVFNKFKKEDIIISMVIKLSKGLRFLYMVVKANNIVNRN